MLPEAGRPLWERCSWHNWIASKRDKLGKPILLYPFTRVADTAGNRIVQPKLVSMNPRVSSGRPSA